MTARDLVARSLRTVLRAVEGAVRPGPYFLPISGGWLPDGAPINWWQLGWTPSGDITRSAMVEACVSAYSQTVAMLPGDHWRGNKKGGRTRVTNSALSRILRSPNAYQSISDFLLNATRSLFVDGNAYALALRNDRFEVSELHLMNPYMCYPQVAQTGDIFYALGGNDVIDRQIGEQYIVPQRDVLHIRLHANRRRPYPLIGESPIAATLADIGVSDAIMQQQTNFYMNEARPSAVLMTDMPLAAPEVQQLRDRWDDQTRGINQGKTPILTHNLKVQPWGIGGRDTQIAEIAKLSTERIALAFRVPLQILGLGGTTFGSTEALMQFWISSGLGFALNHVEQSFDRLFALKGQPDDYCELSTDALMRSALKDRIDALARGVQGGIYSPNEARNQEGLDDVKAGEEPRTQQQVVPLSFAEKVGPAPDGHAPGISPSPAPPAPPAAPPAPAKDQTHVVQREVARARAAVARAGRRYG